MQYLIRLRASVHQITHAEQAILVCRKTNAVKRMLQCTETTVDIADCKVSSHLVGANVQQLRIREAASGDGCHGQATKSPANCQISVGFR